MPAVKRSVASKRRSPSSQPPKRHASVRKPPPRQPRRKLGAPPRKPSCKSGLRPSDWPRARRSRSQPLRPSPYPPLSWPPPPLPRSHSSRFSPPPVQPHRNRVSVRQVVSRNRVQRVRVPRARLALPLPPTHCVFVRRVQKTTTAVAVPARPALPRANRSPRLPRRPPPMTVVVRVALTCAPPLKARTTACAASPPCVVSVSVSAVRPISTVCAPIR